MNLDAVVIVQKLDGLTVTQGAILTQLAMFQNANTGQCNPSLSLLAKHSHAAKSTVAKCLAELEAAGLITRDSPPKGSNRRTNYTLTLPAEVVREPDSPRLRVVREPDTVVRETDTPSPAAGHAVVREPDSHRSVSKVENEVPMEVSAPEFPGGQLFMDPAKASRFVPDDFVPETNPIRMRTMRLPPGIDVAGEFEKFKRWEFKSPSTDWQRRWETWLLNAKPEAQANGRTSNNQAATEAAKRFLNDE